MSHRQDLVAAAVEDRRRDGYSLQKVSQADKNIPADDEGLVVFSNFIASPSSILHQKLPATSEGVFKINFNVLCRN